LRIFLEELGDKNDESKQNLYNTDHDEIVSENISTKWYPNKDEEVIKEVDDENNNKRKHSSA
jgi:hypothetical protein